MKDLLIVYIVLSLTLTVSCGGGNARATAENRTAADQKIATSTNDTPIQYTYNIKAVYPHDTRSYTQGLYWHDGFLWEGTGQYGESALKKVELTTGEVLENIPLERRFFGEGIALLNGKIYQLTWTDGLVFIYDARTLEKLDQKKYPGEGWGLTTDGMKLYMSDGSHEIHIVDPETFRIERSVPVMMGRRAVHEINELEWIDGKIWANVYMSDSLIIIDPDSGKVEGVVDLAGILPAADRTPYTDVLNGIAYDEAAKRIFVTGKYWSKLFEIEIMPK